MTPFFSKVKNKTIAFVGGGKQCKEFIRFLSKDDFGDGKPVIAAVADPDSAAPGIVYAREKGIFTTSSYRDFDEISGIDIIIELTRDETLADRIKQESPDQIEIFDHYQAIALWDELLIDAETRRTLNTLQSIAAEKGPEINDLFIAFSENIKTVVRRHCEYAERVDKELVASERITAQIIQGSTIPTFVIDKDHVLTHWNKALERLTGYSGDQMVGTKNQSIPFWRTERPSMADVILDDPGEEEIRKLYGAQWRKSPLIEDAYEAEVFFPCLGESGKWCFFTAAPIKGPDGSIIGAVETLQDTTEKKEADQERERRNQELAAKAEALRDRERTMAQIIQGSTIPTFVIDRNHVITHWNKALERLSGYAAEDMIGTQKQALPFWLEDRPSMADIVLDQPGDSEIHRHYGQNWRKSALIEDAYEAEIFFPNLSESGKWCFFTAAPIKNPDGKIVGAIETLWDTTEKKQAEEEKERHNRELRLLQEELIRKTNFQARLIRSSNDGIVATDVDLSIVIFNPAAERIFGYNRSEVIDKMKITQVCPSGLADELLARMRLERRADDFSNNETTVMSKTGESIPVRFSGAVLYEKNRVMGSVIFFQDLRDIKKLEKELVRTEKLAAIGQTVASMAHCIKNILHGFKGGSYLVDIGISKNNPDKLKSGWQMIQRNIGRTSELVMDLLSYSKERETEFEPCDPNQIAGEICQDLRETATENHIEILLEPDPSIGRVAMDQQKLYRILLNLMTNALDACLFDDAEKQTWRVSLKTTRESGNRIRFEISDTGMGMKDDVRDKLFDSFFSTKGAKGTGLGMLVTQKLVEEHGGNIDLSTRHGKGTTVVVELPFKEI